MFDRLTPRWYIPLLRAFFAERSLYMNRRLLAPQFLPVLTILVLVVILTAAFWPVRQQRIDVGAPGDDGLLSGFFAPEVSGDGATFRWSSPGSRIPAAGTGAGAAVATLRLNGDLRATLPDPHVQLERDLQPFARFAVQPGWRTYRVLVPAGAEGFDFSATGLFRENRNLGVPVDSVVLAPVAGDPARFGDALARAAALALALAGLALLLWRYDGWADRLVRQRGTPTGKALRVSVITALVGAGLILFALAEPASLLRSTPIEQLLIIGGLVLVLGGLAAWVGVDHQQEQNAPVRRNAYVGIFFIALATLLFQVLLSRIFSVTMFYHFAFVAISIAMFGMTVGAGLVYSFPRLFPVAQTGAAIAWSALAFAVTIVFSFLTFLSVPFSLEASQERSLVDYYAVALTYLVISVPFVFSGICVTLTLTRYTVKVSQLYAADLAGAALGCVLVIAVLQVADGPTAVLVSAALAGLGAIFFAQQRGLGRARNLALATTVLVGSFALYNNVSASNGQPGPFRVVWVRGEREQSALYQKWNHFSRVKIYGDPNTRQAPFSWGLSSAFPANRTFRQVYLQIDSEAGAALAGYHGDVRDIEYLRYDVTNMAHHIRKDANVLVVGIGGGRDLISALAFDQKSVTGVEINGEIVSAVNGPFGDLTGYLYRDPRVEFVVDEARSHIVRSEERYDILQISLIDTWAATTAGAYTFTENSLYTTQAWRIFLDRLTPGGILTVSRWYFADRPGEVYRLTALATEALRARGVAEPRQHMMIVRMARVDGAGPDGVGTLLVSNEPFSAQDIATIEQQANQLGFEVMLTPTSDRDPTFVEIATTPDLAGFVRNYPINIAPPTDDSPFFFHMLRFGDIFDRQKQLFGEVSYNMQAVAILGFLLALVTTLTILFVILPLMLTTQRGALRGAGAPLLYFAGIGMGFMLVEISQMQRLVIFLGHPTYSLAVVLFTLLLSSGLGSFTTGRITNENLPRAGMQRLGLLLGMLLIFGVLTPLIIGQFESANTLQRIAIAVAIIFPLGFCMGMAFPIGMKMVGQRVADLGPWLWGVNGAMGVCASVLAVAIALTASISTTFWIGFGCYVLTFGAFVLETRRSAQTIRRKEVIPSTD
jgi:hypothetical protein